MSVVKKFDESVAEALKSGLIDKKKQGALIEVARKLAEIMDDPEWPIIKGKYDNVSPSSFLKYCSKLGIAPDIAEETKKQKTETVRLVGNTRWKRA